MLAFCKLNSSQQLFLKYPWCGQRPVLFHLGFNFFSAVIEASNKYFVHSNLCLNQKKKKKKKKIDLHQHDQRKDRTESQSLDKKKELTITIKGN